MSLSPALFTALVSDGFRVPAPAAALAAGFTAGDLVVVGADLVGQAANDSAWDGAPDGPRVEPRTWSGSSTCPRVRPRSSPSAPKMAINVTANGVATTGNVATAVAVNGTQRPDHRHQLPAGHRPCGRRRRHHDRDAS